MNNYYWGETYMRDIDDSFTNKSKEPLYYVGIGASAGGLEALQDFFKNIPMDTDMAFIVIQHLSPDYKSYMNELLGRQTKLRIEIAEDGMLVEANAVYLIPPSKNLLIFHGKLYLENQNPHKALNLPIDIFFRSLAEDQGKNAIGVILSGTGSDGTLGVRGIKEAGGMIMVQDEKSAKFDGMPRSSISTGLVDYIIPPEKMPEELLNYIKHPLVRKGETNESIMSKNIDTLTKIILMLRDYCEIDFSYYKQNTMIRRLERRVSINRFNTLEEYMVFFSESNKEKEILYRELLIGVTRFFRDKEAFDIIREKVLPNIDFDKKLIRLWSAGCSTGEEVYSIAMMLMEYIKEKRHKCELKIFATDIDRHSLEIAGKGFYPESIVSDIDSILLEKYFIPKDNGYQIKEEIRKTVVFATHNLLKDPPFSKLDLLICRNLFIYLKPDIQQKILSMFYYSLNKEGFLFMGSSESIGEMSEAFYTIDSKWKIYKYKEGFRSYAMKEIPISVNHSYEGNGYVGIKPRLHNGIRFEKLMENAISTILPPSLIIDENDNILHVVNDINRFSRIKQGRFSPKIYDNLNHEIAIFVNSLIRRMKTEKKDIFFENIIGIKGFEKEIISIEGRIIDLEKREYYILSFHVIEEEPKGKKISEAIDMDEEITNRAKELENELQITKENLQATVEELETSNEELQSSNEELIASNEELQSTNEELQSVNEELFTVNSEYQTKIDDLTRSNNDLDNLIRNTEIGALYLDRNLCIRRITPVVSKITNILESDIGRPISHISIMNEYTNIVEDVYSVVENLQEVNREIKDPRGYTWFTKIRPYRTEYNAVEGILITFVDVSKFKELEDRFIKQKELMQTVLDNSPEAKTLVDTQGNIIYANKKSEDILGITRNEILNRTYDASKWEITGADGEAISSEKLPFSILKRTKNHVLGYQHYIKVPGRKKKLLKIDGVPVIGADGGFEGGVFTIVSAEGVEENE